MPNILYNVVQKVIYNKPGVPVGVELSLQTHRDEETPYFFFALPMYEEMIIGNYRLSNHHLSVCESWKGRIDKKSQYHYTATFHDEETHEYRLHLYFDYTDGEVGEVLLSKKVRDD